MKNFIVVLVFLMGISAQAQTPEWSRKYHTGSVTCLQFSKDGSKLLTGGTDGKVMLWDMSKADTIRTFKRIKCVSLQLF